MLKKILLSLLLLPVLVLAQQQAEQVLQIRNIQGLNTRAGVFTLQSNELTIAHDADFRNPGSVMKRKGYDSVSILLGMDSIVDGGIFAVAYNDGTQQLVVVGDSNGVGYGAVYLSPLGSANIEDSATKIWDYFSVQNKPSFEQYLDRVYIGNGSHRPIVYDKNSGTTRQMPPRASGEPLIVPLNTSGNLHGEYVYRTRLWLTPDLDAAGYDLWNNASGIISARVRVSNGQMMLRNFPRPIPASVGYDTTIQVSPWHVRYIVDIDSVANSTNYWVWINDDSIGYTSDASATEAEIVVNLINSINSTSGDTVTASVMTDVAHGYFIYIRSDTDFVGYACSTTITDARMDIDGDSTWILWVERTGANPGVLDNSDSVGVVKAQEIFYNDTLKIDTFWFIDNTAGPTVAKPLLDPGFYGLDSLGDVVYRYGAPASFGITWEVEDTSAYGVYGGWPLAQQIAYGIGYAVTFVDTVTGIESDTSRICVIWKDSTHRLDSTAVHTISIPRLPYGEAGYKVNLYRGVLTAITNDTVWQLDTIDIREQDYPSRTVYYGPVVWSGEHFKYIIDPALWLQTLLVDSIYISSLVLLAQLDDTVRTFADSIRQDSLLTGGIAIRGEYKKVDSPPLMKGMFTFQNRMFAFYSNRLHYSGLDFEFGGSAITDWQDWDIIIVGEGDGDEIVYAHPARDYIRVFKHNSSYIVYQTDDGFGYRLDDGSFWPHIDYVGAYGCLSPQSFVDAPEGSYYLSNLGVLRENAGQQLARQRDITLASAKLDNFDAMSIDDKGDAVAAYVPSEQIYMLCIGDTTYTYFARADAWATWGFTFSGSALYRAESDVNNYPGDTLYFIKPGESNLYQYGTSDSDNAVRSYICLQTAPLFVDNHDYSITAVGIWGQGFVWEGGFSLIDYNECGRQLFATQVAEGPPCRYSFSTVPENRALYHSLYFVTSIPTVFDGFDVFYIDQGITEKR